MKSTIENKINEKGKGIQSNSNSNHPNSLSKRLRNGAASFMIGASLLGAGLGLGGCASIPKINDISEVPKVANWVDTYGDLVVYEYDYDIYVSKREGKEMKRLTDTKEGEYQPIITLDGKICYHVFPHKAYLMDPNEPSKIDEISHGYLQRLREERGYNSNF